MIDGIWKRGRGAYHDLAEDGQNEVLHVGVTCVRDDENETGDSVGHRGLDEHRCDRAVGRSVIPADGTLRALAHVEQPADEKQREQDVERDRDREVWQRKLHSSVRPQGCIRARGLVERQERHGYSVWLERSKKEGSQQYGRTR